MIENEDFAEVPPPKFKRLTLGGEVRLMGAYIVMRFHSVRLFLRGKI